MIPATGQYRTKVILALLSKTLTVGRAICAVIDAGFPAEAFATSRTLIDIFFTVRYIANKDTENRARKYAEYSSKVRVEWKKIIEEHLPQSAKTLRSLDKTVVKTAEGFQSKAHWIGHGGQARMMALEDDAVEKDEKGKPITSKFDYDAVYFWTSQYVHGTIEGIRGHASESGNIFKAHGRKWEDNNVAQDALCNIAVFTCKTFLYGLRAIHEEQPPALHEMYKLIRTFARSSKRKKKRG